MVGVIEMQNQLYDVVIVGGGAAGLSAALVLGRARRRVAVLDAGAPRNAPAAHLHGYLSRDGMPPAEFLQIGRAEVQGYGVEIIDGMVATVERQAGGFTVTLAGRRAWGRVRQVVARQVGGFTVTLASGGVLAARRLLVTTGLTDELPAIPGLRERWGRDVLHCPYCHGYEVAGRRLGVLALLPFATHQANMIPDWGPTTFLTNGVVALAANERAALVARGVAIEEESVTEILNAGDGLAGVRLADGRTVALDALFTGVPTRLASPLAAQLGCAIDDVIGGPIIRVDAMGQTTVPGVYAAGDNATMMRASPARWRAATSWGR